MWTLAATAWRPGRGAAATGVVGGDDPDSDQRESGRWNLYRLGVEGCGEPEPLRPVIKIWPAATNGDLKAAHVALKIIVERAKLLGLDRQAEDAREQQTIVISGTSDEYIAGLKAIIGAGDSDAS
jgi:hypothetical protein